MIEEINTKTLLQKAGIHNSEWFGIDYNMNLYKGCCHGCIYCDSRSSCYRIEEFDRVRVKANTYSMLYQELKSKKVKGVIGIGAMSDTYNPFEEKLKVTRGALELIEQFGFGVSIDTKSALVLRDIDRLLRIAENQPVIVKLTITTTDDELSGKIEKNVTVSSKRFEALRALSEAGIFCGILFTPMLPFLTDTEENVRRMVRLANECGAKFIYSMFGVTLRENQREHFYQKLNEEFPGLTKKYIDTYGNSYVCESLKSKALRKLLKEECERYGILYRMKDIISAYKKPEKFEQLSIF